jgi:hypothetical protein
VLVALLVLSAIVTMPAQAPLVQVTADKPLTVVAPHDGVNVTVYHASMDGAAPVDRPSSARSSAGTVDFSMPPLGAGPHTLELWATGPGGDGPRLSLAILASVPAPNAFSCAGPVVVTIGPNNTQVVTCQ